MTLTSKVKKEKENICWAWEWKLALQRKKERKWNMNDLMSGSICKSAFIFAHLSGNFKCFGLEKYLKFSDFVNIQCFSAT